MADGSGGSRGGRLVFGVLLLVGLVAIAWAAGRPPRDGEPFDPRSSGELGARGLVLFLRDMGADVTLSREGPTAATDVTLVLDDRMSEAGAEDLLAWVRAGGTLVVADPSSRLSGPLDEEGGGLGDLLADDPGRGVCDLEALDEVEEVAAPGVARFVVPTDGGSCFGDDEAAVIVSEAVGDGIIVSIGSPMVFLNDSLDDRDHAVLAGSLLAPAAGTRVTIVEEPLPGEGDESLGDLVADGVKAALVQLAVAFLVYALFRARRLGRPVREPLPVQIAGSELVVAVGELIQQSRDPDRAASVLQHDTRRTLARRLGLPVDADARLVADAAAGRGGVDADRVLDVLTRPSVDDEAGLVVLARDLDDIRQEILHGQSV
jgi:hypothetical protein